MANLVAHVWRRHFFCKPLANGPQWALAASGVDLAAKDFALCALHEWCCSIHLSKLGCFVRSCKLHLPRRIRQEMLLNILVMLVPAASANSLSQKGFSISKIEARDEVCVIPHLLCFSLQEATNIIFQHDILNISQYRNLLDTTVKE